MCKWKLILLLKTPSNTANYLDTQLFMPQMKLWRKTIEHKIQHYSTIQTYPNHQTYIHPTIIHRQFSTPNQARAHILSARRLAASVGDGVTDKSPSSAKQLGTSSEHPSDMYRWHGLFPIVAPNLFSKSSFRCLLFAPHILATLTGWEELIIGWNLSRPASSDCVSWVSEMRWRYWKQLVK